MPDPLTAATAHLRAAEDELRKMLEPPYKLTQIQQIKVLEERQRLLKIQARIQKLKKKIPPNPPERPFG